MLFKVSDDWKQNLATEDEARLNDILKKVAKHRPAYRSSADVKNAQLWSALLEMHKENVMLLNRIRRMEFLIDGLKERIKQQDEAEKDLMSSLERF